MAATRLPVVQAGCLAAATPEPTWLYKGLWMEQGVGLIGGNPKSCKSWLALEMAVSLATGTDCLGRYGTEGPGTVLIYMAEDGQAMVRQRLDSIADHHGADLDSLPLYVITADTVRLDQQDDRQRLEATVAHFRPALLLLDPLVRLHNLDENRAGDVSYLLAFLRKLQRRYQTAVIVVHHSRKNGSATQPGQALRGSSDLHAFGDSNLYLRSVNKRLVMTFEHRAAEALEPVELRLVTDGPVHLEVVTTRCKTDDVDRAIVELIRQRGPISRDELRTSLAVRNSRVSAALKRLGDAGQITYRDGRYRFSLPDSPSP